MSALPQEWCDQFTSWLDKTRGLTVARKGTSLWISNGRGPSVRFLVREFDPQIEYNYARATLLHALPSLDNEPMAPDDLAYWVDSYNRWVALWNECETDRTRAHSPDWEDEANGRGDADRNRLYFTPRDCKRYGPFRRKGLIRVRGWKAWSPRLLSDPWLRAAIDPASVMAGVWYWSEALS
jgi:hypothetical protein